MSEGRKPPEQVSLEPDFEKGDEPSGLDAVPLLQESRHFPDEGDARAAAETEAPADAADPAEPSSDGPAEQPAIAAEESAEPVAEPGSEPAAPPPESTAADAVLDRFPSQWLKAGLADLVVQLAVVAVGVVAALQLGVPPQIGQWPGYLVFALSFSFLYTSLPLAFWGQTPGMAVAGLRATDDERQLSFGQTALRWLASWLTVATLGLPLVLVRGGRPLADRISRSQTLVWHESED